MTAGCGTYRGAGARPGDGPEPVVQPSTLDSEAGAPARPGRTARLAPRQDFESESKRLRRPVGGAFLCSACHRTLGPGRFRSLTSDAQLVIGTTQCQYYSVPVTELLARAETARRCRHTGP